MYHRMVLPPHLKLFSENTDRCCRFAILRFERRRGDCVFFKARFPALALLENVILRT